MPTSDLDMPLLPSAEQIRRREFATVRRGYDPQQVRAYLTSIAKQVGTLERELSQLRLEAGSAAARGEPSTATPGRALAAPSRPVVPTTPCRNASPRWSRWRVMRPSGSSKNARSESGLALDEARPEADRIGVDAQAHAEVARRGERIWERPKPESSRVLAGLAERRGGLIGQLEEMRSKLLTVAEDLVGPIEEAARAEAGYRSRPAVWPRLVGRRCRRERVGEGEAPLDPRYCEGPLGQQGPVGPRSPISRRSTRVRRARRVAD